MTKAAANFRERQKQQRESRIKSTKNFILTHTSTSLLNNHKWFQIFQWLEEEGSQFELRQLLSSQEKLVTKIYEVERTSALLDDTGDFIEFLEIEFLRIKKTDELVEFLDRLNIGYTTYQDKVEISGYSRQINKLIRTQITY